MPIEEPEGPKPFLDRLFTWLPDLDREERKALVERLKEGAIWNKDFAVMIALSSMIASLGLLQNSAAIVIGAMVLAPLMMPLNAAGFALVQGNLDLFRRAMVALLLGIVVAFGLSFLLGLAIPRNELTLELQSRGAPNLLDLFVAFLSGIAAAYAFARPALLGALAGVAIAAALVPPLAAGSIALSDAHMKVFHGAVILFVTNLVAIILGAALVYRALGLHISVKPNPARKWVKKTILWLGLSAVILSAPLGYRMASQLVVGQSRPFSFPVTRRVKELIEAKVDEEPTLGFVYASRAGGVGEDVRIRIVLTSTAPVSNAWIAELEDVVRGALGQTAVVKVHIFKPVERV